MNQHEENFVSDIFDGYNDTQKEVMALEIRKVRNKLFIIAAVFLFFELLAIAMSGLPFGQLIGWALVLPAAFTSLGFLANKEPLVATIIGMIVVLAVWVWMVVMLGGKTIVQGWLGKALIIYLLLAALQSAREAARIKKEL